MLSGHRLKSGLVYRISPASFLSLLLFPVLVGMWRKSALTRHDVNTDVFSVNIGEK